MPLKLIVSTRKPHRRRIVVDKTSNRPPFTRPQQRTRSRTSQIRTKATEETSQELDWLTLRHAPPWPKNMHKNTEPSPSEELSRECRSRELAPPHREGEVEEKGGDPLPMVRSDTRSKTSAPEPDQKKTLNKPNTLIFRCSEPNTPDLNRGGDRA